MNESGSLLKRVNSKSFYLSLLGLCAISVTAIVLIVPSYEGTASAQKRPMTVIYDKELMAMAVDMKSAGLYSVYAEKGSSAENVKGETFDGRSEGLASVKSDLKASMNWINNLPCTAVAGDLSGRTFEPGIYCVDSGRLSGELTFNGGGDASAMFIVRIKGDLSVADNSRVTLADGASSGNVYIVAEKTAELGDGVDFKGHMLAGGDVNIGSGTKVSGRTVSVEGSVTAGRGAELSVEAGTLEICKDVISPNNPPPGVEADTFNNRIWSFTVAGINLTVPAGQCSAPFSVPSGVQTIQEGNAGTFTNMTGTWTGGFALDSAFIESDLSNSRLVGVNRPLRQIIVNIADPGSILIVHAINRPAVTAIVELCKAPQLLNVNQDLNFSGGIFFFTVGGVFDPAPSGQPGTNTLKVFRAPLGGCTGPITVEVPSPFPLPATIPVFVSELGPAQSAATGIAGAPKGFELVNIEVVSESGQLLAGPAFDYLLSGFNTTTLGPNEGGGVAIVSAAVTSPLDPNNASQETRVLFSNRPLPSVVKVCKVAGPGIPLNTPFVFEVRGFIAEANPPAAGRIYTFQGQVRFVEVLAGPAAQGGNCTIVRDADGTASAFGNSVNAVLVREFGALDPAVAFDPNPTTAPPTVTQLADSDGILRDIRVSRIRAFVATPNGQISPGVFVGSVFTIAGQAIDFGPLPDLTPNSALVPANDRATSVGAVDLGRAAVVVRQNEVAVEFTDILFNPTEIKICKIAGNGIAPGTPFTFTVTQNQPPEGSLLPAFSTNVTVPAGPGDQGGFCAVVPTTLANGASPGLVGGAFNTGSSVTITENGNNNVAAIASSTTLFTRNGATIIAGPLVEATNVFTYTNNGTTTRAAAVKFDFDGDHKADAAVWSPATNSITFAKSGSDNQLVSTISFGRSTDVLVVADYDGDGIADRAVFRPENGQWYWLGSAINEYRITGWGQAGDIPVAGDYDGDGRADYIVFRPSNGNWYILTAAGRIVVFQFGVSTDKPILADYDGDGKTDIAVFRPSTGQWFIAESRDGFAVYNFGVSTDKPVPADYDGDGKADIAVFRNAGGIGRWFILGTTGTFTVIDFGNGTDAAAPADYNGDGKTDLAVYRPSEGKWYIRFSGLTPVGTIGTISLGEASDIALPSL